MRATFSFLTLAILGLIGTTAQADVFVPAGLNPGDEYQLAFVTAGGIDANSPIIETYNNFVVAQAALNPTLTGTDLGISYSAIASTQSINANVNALVEAPVYLLNSTLVATDFADMWDGSLNSSININQFGQSVPTDVWTGSTTAGTGLLELGSALPLSGTGISTAVNSSWIANGSFPKSLTFSIYGLSEKLTVSAVPEPATTGVLLGLSLLGLCRRPKRTR